MLTLLVQFALLAAVIVVAGTFLAKSGDALGERTGMGGSLAGMVLLAGATSLPELAVDCSAVAQGLPDLAVGDIFGSSLFNLLILAAIDLSFRQRGRMLSKTSAAHAISAAASLSLTAIALGGLLLQGALREKGMAPWTVFGLIDPALLVVGVAYFAFLRLVYFDQRYVAASENVAETKNKDRKEALPSLARATTIYLLAAAAIFAAAPFLAKTADGLAEATGLGASFVGSTLVALSTSLPEIVTTVAAVRMGAPDMAVGNIFGSNTFNIVILLAADCFSEGSLLAAVSPTHAVTAAGLILATAIALASLLYRAEKRYWLLEPDAVLLAVAISGTFGIAYILR